jgi:hypothetical protein
MEKQASAKEEDKPSVSPTNQVHFFFFYVFGNVFTESFLYYIGERCEGEICCCWESIDGKVSARDN